MELSKYREYKDYFTGKTSELVHQFAFAGIAIIWIFNKISEDRLLPDELILPLLIFVITLGLSFLHYLYGGFAWSIFHRYHEKKKERGSDPDVYAPKWINWPTLTFYLLKVISLVFGYYLLIKFLLSKI